MSQVIVLNVDFTLINTVSVKRALAYLEKGKAEIVKSTGRLIRSSKRVVEEPRVVRFLYAIKAMYKAGVSWSKANVHIRDRYVCQYCGTKLTRATATIDHIIPQDRNGRNTFENTVSSCFPCNNHKQNRTPSEANMTFFKKGYHPYRPSVMEFYLIKIKDEGLEQVLTELGVY